MVDFQEAVLEIKENRKVTRTNPAIKIEAKAFLPAEYISETAQRLEIYHRLSRVNSFPEIDDLREELQDRYGPVPEPVSTLLNVIAIRFVASNLQASGVTIRADRFSIEFPDKPELPAETLGRILKELPPNTQVGYEKPLSLNVPLPKGDVLEETKKILRPLL